MNRKIKISIYWILIGICMILHTQFESMGLFFGQDIAMPDSNGVMPSYMPYLLVITMVFPLIFGLLQLNIKAKWYLWLSFIWSIILIVVNIYHLFSEGKSIEQGVLLTFVLIINIILIIELNKTIKQIKSKIND